MHSAVDSAPAPDNLIACPDCDALFTLESLGDDERMKCPKCASLLCEHRTNALSRATAFALSAGVLFFVAHFFPFLSLEVGGQTNQISLFNSSDALYANGSPWLAFVVAVFVIGAPAALISGILYVLVPLFWKRTLPGAIGVCRWVYDAGPWNMIEIFMLGILVSMLKLTKIAQVHLGVSFWAFALLIVCVTASFGAIDRTELWQRLEEAKQR